MTAIRKFGLLAPLSALALAGCGLNSVPTAEEQVNAKWGDLQADYQRRADLIPNLVETVKGYAQQEKTVLTQVTEMHRAREYTAGGVVDGPTVHVYEMGPGGPAAELHVAVEPNAPPAGQGAGGVHHVAFRTPTFAEYDQWLARLNELRIPNSGPVDRFYFKSLYFREPNGILFEIATDQPGFTADEPMDSLGEHLSLPPFLEPQRAEIEANLHPI